MALRQILALVVATGWTLCTSAGAARALQIAPDPFVVDHGTILGSVELVDVVIGLPSGGSVGLGVLPPDALTLVFEVRIDPASDPAGGVWLRVSDGLGGISPDATGWVPGPDTDIFILGTSGAWRGFVPATTVAGTVVDRVFLSFAAPLASDGSLGVEASLLSGPIAGGSALLVPEPHGALLLAGGLGLLAAVRRRAKALR